MEYSIRGTVEINGKKVQVEAATPELVARALRQVVSGGDSPRPAPTTSSTKLSGRNRKGKEYRLGIRTGKGNRGVPKVNWKEEDLRGVVKVISDNMDLTLTEVTVKAIDWIQAHGVTKDRKTSSIATVTQRLRTAMNGGNTRILSPLQKSILKSMGYGGEVSQADLAQNEGRTVPVRVITSNYLEEA